MHVDHAEPERRDVEQAVFGTARFWSGLNRLADQAGHAGHPRALHGAAEPTNQYAYDCISCGHSVVVVTVQRTSKIME